MVAFPPLLSRGRSLSIAPVLALTWAGGKFQKRGHLANVRYASKADTSRGSVPGRHFALRNAFAFAGADQHRKWAIRRRLVCGASTAECAQGAPTKGCQTTVGISGELCPIFSAWIVQAIDIAMWLGCSFSSRKPRDWRVKPAFGTNTRRFESAPASL